jgi:SAM-dependent methyltransferase
MRRALHHGLLAIALVLGGLAPAAAQFPPTDPPYVPTPRSLVNAMLDMASVGPGDMVYDLGSGDGRIVIMAAERGARGVGIEYEGWLVARSWVNADSAGVRPLVRFEHADIFETDLHDASVVMLYLGADFNLRLRPRLLEQLEPGSRVVSHAFHMGEWEPDSTRTIGSGAERATLFSWIIPADVDGFWSLQIEGMEALNLELGQRYQTLEGEAWSARGSLTIEEGRLRGREIRFQVVDGTGSRAVPLVFTGTLEGGRLSGTVQGPRAWGVRRWQALRFSDPALGPS